MGKVPFTPCEGIWSISFDNHSKVGRFQVNEGQTNYTIALPVIAEYAPAVQFAVGLVGLEPRTSKSSLLKNAYAYGSFDVQVSQVTIFYPIHIFTFSRNFLD